MQSLDPTVTTPDSGPWVFATPPCDEAGARSIRLECAKLALQVHDAGFADDGATVMETTRLLAEFVESGE